MPLHFRSSSCQSCIEGVGSFVAPFLWAQSAVSKSKRTGSDPPTRQTGSGFASTVDAGLLRVWRRRVLDRLLVASDENLIRHVTSFLEDVLPPSFAIMNATGVGLFMRALSAEVHWPGPHMGRLAAIAADSSGQAILAGASAEYPVIIVWDLRTWQTDDAGGTLPHPKRFGGLAAPARCLWIDVVANCLAAGCADGTVQIWASADGQLLATCVAYILESTRWSTVGHSTPVQFLCGAPAVKLSELRTAGLAIGASVASADDAGMICLWQDNVPLPMPALCVDIAFEASKLGLRDKKVTCLTSAPGLVVCGFIDAVICISALGGDVTLVLPVEEQQSPASTRHVGAICHILFLARSTSGSLLCEAFAMTDAGAVLHWDVEVYRAPICSRTRKPAWQAAVIADAPVVLAEPCSQQGVATGDVASGQLCWISSDEERIRWFVTKSNGENFSAAEAYIRGIGGRAAMTGIALLPIGSS